MAIIGVPNLKATGVPEDVTRSKRWRDGILRDVANSGVRFMFDLAFPYSYPGGDPLTRPAAGNPAMAAVVQDMTEIANASVITGDVASIIAYAGGGFDFTNSRMASGAGIVCGIETPASVIADIFTAFGGKSQRFLVVDYMKLPAKANWNATATILQVAGDAAFNAAPSFINMAFANGNQIQTRRQTAAGVASQLSVVPNDADFGTVCQIAAWRTDTATGLRVRSLTSGVAATIVTAAVGADNTQDPTANKFVFGRSNSFLGPGTGVIAALSGMRIHRGFIENLARSGRDPVAVADADFTAQVARNAFS